MKKTKIKIEIAHPNDVTTNEWTKVEEISSVKQIQDHLDSPSFDVESGTCVRIRQSRMILYSGIYNGKSWIDVGSDSVFINDRWSDRFSVSPKKMNQMDLFSRYTLLGGDVLLDGISILVPEMTILKASLECFKFALSHLTSEPFLYRKLVFKIERWMVSDMPMSNSGDISKIMKIGDQCYRDGIETERTLYNMGAAAHCLSSISVETSIETLEYLRLALKNLHLKKPKTILGDEIRKVIPFHEIVRGAV